MKRDRAVDIGVHGKVAPLRERELKQKFLCLIILLDGVAPLRERELKQQIFRRIELSSSRSLTGA